MYKERKAWTSGILLKKSYSICTRVFNDPKEVAFCVLCAFLHYCGLVVFKEPPYEVAESGYGSFMLPVEVFFRNKEEPRKVLFEYDLVLPNLHDPPINEVRSECLTFQNPSDEFKKKLLMSGAVSAGGGGSNLPIPKKKKHSGEALGGEPPKKKKKKDSSSDSESSSGEESDNNEVTAVKKEVKDETRITWDATNLKQLHKQLNAIQDPTQLQEIVNIVENTQIYQLTATTFDFDLCKLDEATLNKLHTLVESFS